VRHRWLSLITGTGSVIQQGSATWWLYPVVRLRWFGRSPCLACAGQRRTQLALRQAAVVPWRWAWAARPSAAVRDHRAGNGPGSTTNTTVPRTSFADNSWP